MEKELQRFIDFGLMSASFELQIAIGIRSLVADTIENNDYILELEELIYNLRMEIKHLQAIEKENTKTEPKKEPIHKEEERKVGF